MVDYGHGKIYKLWSLNTDEFYVGSTTQTLCKRMSKHKCDAHSFRRPCKLYITMNEHGIDSFRIELIELYPCVSKDELRKREGEVIRELKPQLNMLIAGRSTQEYRNETKEQKQIYDKQYYKTNQCEKLLYQREYEKEHKDIIKIQKQLYYQKNKDKFKAKFRQRYENNKDKELLIAKERKYTCTICGICIRTDCRIRHKNSKKYIELCR